MGSLTDLIRSERLALIDFLETLAPEEWAVPSLCAGWTVQDVAAHLAWSSSLAPLEVAAVALRAGFRMNRVNEDNARRWSARGPGAVLEQLRVDAAHDLRPPGTTEKMALTDAVCHAVDIRRPLGKPRRMDAEAFPIVADSLARTRWPATAVLGGNARARVAGVRLVADDLDWTHGAGPVVRAPAEVLLRLLAGRRVAVGELHGPGAATVNDRL